jgi:hypothetical protein
MIPARRPRSSLAIVNNHDELLTNSTSSTNDLGDKYVRVLRKEKKMKYMLA